MPRPNLLMIMPDQQRADCIGAFGNQSILTPNIDALALKGMKFTNAYVNHPVCSPSRVNFMTGWYPHTRGHRTLTHLIQPHEPNLLRYLKDGGYHVAWAGARGDVFAPGVTEASTHFSGFTTPPKKMGMGPQHPIGSPLYDAFYHGLRPGEETWLDFDEACTRTAIDWLAQKPKGPWCLWAPLIFPHLPFEVEQQWYDLYSPEDLPKRISSPGSGKPQFHQAIREKLGTDRLTEDHWQEIRRVYYAMISRVDHQLGRILDALELTGEADNTFVLYFTDHGEYAGDFGLVEKWPSGLDRSLLQNPLIIAGPGVKPNTTAATFTEMVDLMPTLLDLADIKVTHTHFGRSLVDVLSDPEAKIRDAAFSEGGFVTDELNLLEVAKGEYANKANLQHEQPSLVGRAIAMRTELYTYIYRLYESDELYDRSDDPNETENLIDHPEHKGRINDMKSKVLDWLFSSADVIPWTADPRFPKISHGGHDIFSNQG